MAETIAGHVEAGCAKLPDDPLQQGVKRKTGAFRNGDLSIQNKSSRLRLRKALTSSGKYRRAVVGTLTEPRSCPRREKPNSESHPTSVRIATPCLQGLHRQTTLPSVEAAGGLAVTHLIIEYRQAPSLISSADAALDAPQTGQIQRDVSRMESLDGILDEWTTANLPKLKRLDSPFLRPRAIVGFSCSRC